ncbi:MAG: alpha/beta hydrolase [Alphaproteobacteria bacterium]|nr:alpha/beta hydrolase [Alphaproteobacteria bacterium]
MSPFDHRLVTERYFFPRPDRVPEPTLVQVAGLTLRCRHRVVDPAALTLVHLHGNGEVVADYIPDLEGLLRRMGLNTLFLEYRGYGGSEGTPQLAAMLPDGAAALTALGLDPARCVAYGRSIGSIYAIELAARCPALGGLVLESGIADVLQRVALRVTPRELGCDLPTLQAEARRLFNHEAKLGGYAGPLLVLHARGDHLVHPSHAEQNHAWGGGADKRLLLFERGDHNSVLAWNLPEILEAVGELARRVDATP